MQNKLVVIAGTLGVILIMLVAMVGVMLHMQTSLAQAVNDLQVCERDGMSECHIEQDTDGTYSVYGVDNF